MIRCFLSHSSQDKLSYVRLVADRLGPGIAVYDEWTFGEGMRPLDEILKNLHSSQLFVIFLSDSALNSRWVHAEITNAKQLYDIGQLKRIYPIIIDRNINYMDPRIPQWMREEYNLKLIRGAATFCHELCGT